MFEKTAQKLDHAAILGMLGGVEKELSFELRRRRHTEKEADSLARQMILESMRAANVKIDDYYSVESWAKAFRLENLGKERRRLLVYGAVMLCLWGGLAALGWHFSRILFYVGIPLWGLGVIGGLGAVIMGVMKVMQREKD